MQTPNIDLKLKSIFGGSDSCIAGRRETIYCRIDISSHPVVWDETVRPNSICVHGGPQRAWAGAPPSHLLVVQLHDGLLQVAHAAVDQLGAAAAGPGRVVVPLHQRRLQV